MEDMPSYEKFCEQRGLDQSKSESKEQYKLYLEVAGHLAYDFLDGYLHQEH